MPVGTFGWKNVDFWGICVADLSRSVTFYKKALGFQELSRLAVEGEHSAMRASTSQRRRPT